MPDTSDLNGFLNDVTAKDNDVVEVLDAGTITMKKDANTGKEYPQLNINVRLNGRTLIWTPNAEARAVFNKKYGTKTEAWVGKKFQVKLYPKTVYGVPKIAVLPVLIEK